MTIPRSEFLDQAHIRTICTRVQFAAKQCPKGSIYGHVTATTPLFDYTLSGPVYLRSSDHEPLINSRDICQRTYRVDLKLEGHSGAQASGRPPLRDGKCGKAKRKHRRGSGGHS